MQTQLSNYFKLYPQDQAPFMHRQFMEWKKSRPLAGLKVLHHAPVVQNTLLKIACLVAAGAEIIVTNPNFMSAHPEALLALKKDNIPYVDDISNLKGKNFDIYFDCGAELYQTLAKSPRLGAVELTASGDQFYRTQPLNFPVISIDPTFTKQLETLFGSAVSANKSISQLTGLDVSKKFWIIFGFGKIGRGLAYYCVKNQSPLTVVDFSPHAILAAQSLGIRQIHPEDTKALQAALAKTDIVVTATGKKSILDLYPKNWFDGKILEKLTKK